MGQTRDIFEIIKKKHEDGTWSLRVHYAQGYSLLTTMLTEKEVNEREAKLVKSWGINGRNS